MSSQGTGVRVSEIKDAEWAARPKAKILLVDDRPSNLDALEAILEDLGQDLVRATSGKEALRHLLKEDFAVILLDVKMPEMDGFETAALIRERERSRHTPILFLTAHRDEEHIFRGYYAGAVDFLYKPLNPEVLRSKVSVFVDLARKTELLRRNAEVLEARNAELENVIRERERAEEDVRRLNAELEERVKQRTAELSYANEELRQFAYAASHDLQEPLRTITIYTQLIAQRIGHTEDRDLAEFVNFVVTSTRRMSDLLNDLLAYSQASDRALDLSQPVPLEGVLAGVMLSLNALIDETGARITSDPLPTVYADFTQLTRVFQNLLSNALKYRNGEEPEVHVSARQSGGEWQLSVRDNGIGIEPGFHNHIFGIFKRLHGKDTPGTGMGLAICKKIIERHGGRIWVESEGTGKGSTFVFTLPAH
jgi:signal transduction histidine kinase